MDAARGRRQDITRSGLGLFLGLSFHFLQLQNHLRGFLPEIQYGAARFGETSLDLLVFFQEGIDFLNQLPSMGSFLRKGRGAVDALIDPAKIRFRLLAQGTSDLVHIHLVIPPGLQNQRDTH